MIRCQHEELYIVRDYKGRPLTELGWYFCAKCAASFVGVFPDVDEDGYLTHPPEDIFTGTNNRTRYVKLEVTP